MVLQIHGVGPENVTKLTLYQSAFFVFAVVDIEDNVTTFIRGEEFDQKGEKIMDKEIDSKDDEQSQNAHKEVDDLEDWLDSILE
eukprot:gene2875-1113_t